MFPFQPIAVTTHALAAYRQKPELFIARKQLTANELLIAQQISDRLDLSNAAAYLRRQR